MITDRPLGTLRVAGDAFCMLKTLQQERGSSFDKATERALKSVLQHMEDHLFATRAPSDLRYYLSSLDPGKGKTEATCMFLKAWKASGFREGGGVLVAVSRLAEIIEYIERSQLDEEDFAVLVSSKEALGTRGRNDGSEAPVLFTTHEMIRRRSRKVGLFAALSCFHYQGLPRTCRIWDEAMMPAQPRSIRLDAIRSLLEPLRPINPKGAEYLGQLINDTVRTPAGTTLRLPLLLGQLKTGAGLLPLHVQELLETLGLLAGKEVTVMSDNRYGSHFVAAVDELPADFAPAIILDASGRVRETYRIWEKTRGNLVRLPPAANDYSKLTIHHWDRPGSRSSLLEPKARQALLQVVTDLIDAQPSEEWLVIHHKACGEIDVQKELLALIDAERAGQVHFCHWGAHHGTNAYRKARHVVVVGLLHYSQSTYQAHIHAAAGEVAGEACPETRLAMAIGEHQHNLLQAICRASVRNSSSGVCGACTAYVIGKVGKYTKEWLSAAFPNANVKNWTPYFRPLRGHTKKVTEALDRRFADFDVCAVRKADLRMEVGLGRSQDLAQILSREEVQKWLADRGLTTTTREFVRVAA